MKRSFRNIFILAISALLAGLAVTACHNQGKTDNNDYGATTQQLVTMVQNNPELKALLEEAIAKAKEINPDPATNPAQSLEEYYEFLDFSQTAMPWEVMITPGQPTLGGRMNQALCYCYYINTMPLESLEGKNFFTNSVQYVEPYNEWLVEYCKSWGRFLSTEESWNAEYEALVMQQPELGMGWYEDPSNWHSFNDFFARRLKDSLQRPIASANDASVVVSPCDGVPQGVWPIDDDSYLMDNGRVTLKSREYNSVRNLIG